MPGKPGNLNGAANMQHVLVTISGAPVTADDIAGYFEAEEWEATKHDDVSLPRRFGVRSREFRDRLRMP